MSPDTESLLSTEEAARRLGVSSSTLAKARLTGAGPRFVKIGASVRYRACDLDAFAADRVRSSTSECAPTAKSTAPSGRRSRRRPFARLPERAG